jgi:MFS family permease
MTLAGDTLPKERMASGMGIYGLTGSIGLAIGPWIGENILRFGTYLRDENFGFTCVFLFAMMSFFVGIIPSYLLLPDRKTKQDILSTGAWYKNIVSVHAIPMSIVMFLNFVGWSLYNVYIVEFAKELGITGISSFYAVLAMGLMITRPASGWLTDRFGLTKIIPPALILFALSFQIIGFGKSLSTMLAGAAIASVGFGSFQPALFSMCILSETPLRRSVASNTLYIGIDLGLFLGPIMGSMIYKLYSYSTMFKTASLMILLALIVFIVLMPAYYRRRRVLEAMETE